MSLNVVAPALTIFLIRFGVRRGRDECNAELLSQTFVTFKDAQQAADALGERTTTRWLLVQQVVGSEIRTVASRSRDGAVWRDWEAG